MAGSRLEKVGTIFSRVTGLIRAGAMKEEDKPLWYDVYKAFPPKQEPKFFRVKENKEIKPIIYPEDVIRAKFYKKYGSPGLIDLTDQSTQHLSERYVKKYQELEKAGNVLDIEMATEEALAAEGIILKRDKTGEKESKIEVKQSGGQPESAQSVLPKGFKIELIKDSEDNSASDKT